MNNEKILVSANTLDEGVDLIYRESSNSMLLTNPPQFSPDKIYKEQWRIIGGTLQLDKVVEGIHIPSYVVEEKIEFKE